MNAATHTEARAVVAAYRQPAIFDNEVTQEVREEAAICDVDSLTEFLLNSETAFKHRYWLTTAADIERDYLNAKKYPANELTALLFLSARPAVVMACRAELKGRYLAKALRVAPLHPAFEPVMAQVDALTIRDGK